MVYRASFSFDSTPIAREIKISCGPVKKTFRYPYTDGIQVYVPHYEGSTSEVDYRISISVGDGYDDLPDPTDTSVTCPYTVTVVGNPPGVQTRVYNDSTEGGGVSAAAFDTSDIYLNFKGFFPFNLGSNVPQHLQPLYLYGWSNSNIGTIYTNSSTPASGDNYYKSNGIEYKENELQGGGLVFSNTIQSVGSGTIVLTGDSA